MKRAARRKQQRDDRHNDEGGIVNITPAGRAALECGAPMPDILRLLIEIGVRTEDVTEGHLAELICSTVKASGGDILAAIEAVKSGEIKFRKLPRADR
jgi:hypothetical protein